MRIFYPFVNVRMMITKYQKNDDSLKGRGRDASRDGRDGDRKSEGPLGTGTENPTCVPGPKGPGRKIWIWSRDGDRILKRDASRFNPEL